MIADAQLITHIRTFGIQGSDAVIQLSAKIVSERGVRIVAGTVFNAPVPSRSGNGVNAANAVNNALRFILVKLVQWTSTKI